MPLPNPAKFRTALAGLGAVAVAIILIAAIELGLSDIDAPGRRALMIFAVAIVGWTLTPLDDTFVALAAAVAMALLVAGSPEDLFRALGDNLIWLLVAAFIFAAVFRASGLADVLVRKVALRARSVRTMFHALTAVMIGGAFVFPSTAGRAAMMLPVFTAIAAKLESPVRVALALLIPTVILLSAFGSLVGAGAHIAAVEMLTRTTSQTVSFAYWTLLCLPLAVLSSFLAAELILRLFLNSEQRGTRLAPIEMEETETKILQQPIVWIMGLVLLGWLTAPWHGINETLIAIIGALLVTAPRFGPISLKEALKQVDWNLLVFLAATISLAQTMIRTDLADQLLDGPFGDIEDTGLPPLAIAAMVALIGMALHLVVHSRTARVAALLPPVLLLADEADLNPVSLMLVTVAATGFCQTLLVSAKPVILFGQIEGVTYKQRDLLRLSAVLAPLHLALIVLFAGLVWPWLGVDLVGED
jgi:solute carrier family 13 (sodium-dependent dicarboxylate transporter), member 2/3/5